MLSKSSHGVACGGRQWVTIFHASNVFIARQLYRRIVTSGRDDISAERPKNWTKMGANSCPVSTPWFLFNRPLWGNEIHHRWNRSTEESNPPNQLVVKSIPWWKLRGENVVADYPLLQQANLSKCSSYSARELSFPKSKHCSTRSSFWQEAGHLDDPDLLQKNAPRFRLGKRVDFSTKNLLPWKD